MLTYVNNILRRAKNEFSFYGSKINWIVFVFIVIFTIGSWLDLNGMWCELPIMVHELPEGWRLPSILGAIIQLSQIGSLIFLLVKYFFPKKISLVATIYTLFFIGSISCFLLVYLWNKTIEIGNEKRSIGLYILTFSLGLLDGTSTVTFLPYIGNFFKKEYVIPNYVGESLSSMIPSILGILQGVGSYTKCESQLSNSNNTFDLTSNQTISMNQTFLLVAPPLQPAFTVSSFFLIMFIILIISTISFTLLHFTPISKQNRSNDSDCVNIIYNRTNLTTSVDYDKVSYTSLSSLMEQKVGQVELIKNQDEINDQQENSKLGPKERVILLITSMCVSFIVYGILPAFQSYSTLPYGKNIFHLSINLSSFFTPFSIMFSIFSYDITTKRILLEFLIAFILSCYVITIAVMSPCPILVNYRIGAIIIVLSWIIIASLFIRIRCCIATKLQQCGQNILYIFGSLTIIGQVLGGIIAFVIVDVNRLLKDLSPCDKIEDVCALN